MLKTLLTTAALILMAGPVDAQSQIRTAKKGGVEAATGTAWFDQTAGQPIISFPLGCASTGTCDYSLRLEYVPIGAVPGSVQESDASEDGDRCVFSIRFHSPVEPLKTRTRPEGMNTAPLGDIKRFPHEPSSMIVTQADGDAGCRSVLPGSCRSEFLGSNYQYLSIKNWWLEISGANCLVGFRACYHSSAKGFYNRGLSCPLGD
jgi:hypothetical protein